MLLISVVAFLSSTSSISTFRVNPYIHALVLVRHDGARLRSEPPALCCPMCSLHMKFRCISEWSVLLLLSIHSQSAQDRVYRKAVIRVSGHSLSTPWAFHSQIFRTDLLRSDCDPWRNVHLSDVRRTLNLLPVSRAASSTRELLLASQILGRIGDMAL